MRIDPLHLEPDPSTLDTEQLVLVVVGAHLRAETCDRPLAYSVRAAILEKLDDLFGDTHPFDVVVCTDVWRLNNEELAACPTVSIGGPGVNALAAFLADRTPSLFVIDDVMMIQADPEWEELIVSCWGMNHESTVASVRTFLRRFLDDFLRATIRRLADTDV